MSRFVYTIFGLAVELPYEVEFLSKDDRTETRQPPGEVDIRVEWGRTPERLPDIAHRARILPDEGDVELSREGELLLLTRRARCLVRGGREIIVEKLDHRNPPPNRAVFNYCVPAAVNQRGMAVLHAIAVETPSGAVVVSGDSGSGKSTLLVTLMNLGYPMLSDDLTVLDSSPSKPDALQVLPGYPTYNLCSDTVERVPVRQEQLQPLKGPRRKFKAHVSPGSISRSPVPLHSIHVLEEAPVEDLEQKRLRGVEAFRHIYAHSFPPLSILPLPSQLPLLGRLARTASLYRVRRPPGRWTADELAALVLRNSQSPGRREASER